jgi:hypothetical protein
MYDTLKIFIPILNILNSNYIEVFESILLDKIQTKFENGYLIKGNYKNLTIKITQSGITFEGSLHKYIKGYNLEPISLKEIENAIFELSETFQIDLMQGIVRRLDYSNNIIVEYKPQSYFAQFADAPRMVKKVFKTTENIEYSNKGKTLLMYDKILDATKQKQTIGNEWANKNVLRIELRYLTRINKRFNLQQVFVSELLKPNFFLQLHQNWINEYFKIKRSKNINMNDKKLTAKQMEELASMKVLQMDNEFIEILKANAKSPKEFNRFKSKFNKLLSKESESELLIELDKKVNDIKPILS